MRNCGIAGWVDGIDLVDPIDAGHYGTHGSGDDQKRVVEAKGRLVTDTGRVCGRDAGLARGIAGGVAAGPSVEQWAV